MKRIVIELDENESVDSYAIYSSLEKVKELILRGVKSGTNPKWSVIEDEKA